MSGARFTKRVDKPIDSDKRIDEALARGISLRFTGFHFEEIGRPHGTGPRYSTNAVLRRFRVGKAMLVPRSGEEGELGQLEVRAAPRRTSDALAEGRPA